MARQSRTHSVILSITGYPIRSHTGISYLTVSGYQIARLYGEGKNISELTFDKFVELLDIACTHELGTTYKYAQINDNSYRPPLYMWIVDAREAIFAISTTTPTFFGEAFWTTDPHLISALLSMHKEYRQQKDGVQGGHEHHEIPRFGDVGSNVV